MTRFLHTGDWQLGMTRHFLSEEAQARFSQDRLDAIRALGRVAEQERCEFVVVCGDVFESNQVDRRTLVRAAEALREIQVPVYLLPGNHDPLDAASVLRSGVFRDARQDHVRVLFDAAADEVVPGVELVGAPWSSKRPLRDLVTQACDGLDPAEEGVVRIVVAHGAVDALSPDATDPAVIQLDAVEAALADGRIHYLALGDRHSVTDVGTTGRVWYSGAPEATDYDEQMPGHVLVVDVTADSVEVVPHRVGRWSFVPHAAHLGSAEDVADLARWLDELPDKERTTVKLSLEGTLTLSAAARLDAVLEDARDRLGALETWARHTDLVVVPDDTDFADIELSGFAQAALDELRAAAEAGGDSSATARDALALLVRLAGAGS